MEQLYQIVVWLAGNVVQRLPLAAEVLTLGRTPDNALPLPDPAVSRRHAELRRDLAGLSVTDLGSANGTFVGQLRLPPNQPHTFLPGERLQIGPYELTLEPASKAGAQEPSPGPVEPATAGDRPPLPPPEPAAPPRPSLPAPARVGRVSRYLRYLPAIYQDADFLARYLMIMESVWEPLEERQDHIAMYFDPRTCPASLLPWLARWLDLDLDPAWPESRLRQVVASGMEIQAWRGTLYGLGRAIEAAMGLRPEIEEDPERPFVFRVRVRLPSGDDGASRLQLDRLIRSHKPAHTGYVLEVES